MCGIAGILAPDAGRHDAGLARMVAALRHRGPDASGRHVFDSCALGHARLSIVDLAGGAQPMLSGDGRTGLTFNGEIYGYKAVRRTLGDYPFRTAGDTEVLLALHQRYGDAMLPHLPGMFAFAIWDDRERKLFCARDRFGEKPFYYAFGAGGEFVFASEIKSILASGLVKPVLDAASVRDYLRRGYVPAGKCIYRGIHTLPPAHSLTYADGRLEIRRYWSLPPGGGPIPAEAAVEEFKRLMDQAVARQLVADVPVGTFLSGGLDSSTIVALAARHHPHCKTFSFGFGKSIDELPYAREIAARYGTDHIELSDQEHDIAGLLALMQDIYDEPLGDSANIPTYLISKLARQHVTVALAGEGADELLGGYGFWYRPLFNLEKAKSRPAFTATLIRALAAGCRLSGRKLPASLDALREGFFLGAHYGTALQAHRARNAYFSENELDRLGLPDEGGAAGGAIACGTLDDVFRDDLQDYLPGDILVKTDRASMANSLEMRCPFLDVDLASFCIALPASLKINDDCDKYILRRAFGEAWTDSIRKRNKQGFGAPVGDWFRRKSVADLKNELLGNSQSRIFDRISFQDTRSEFVADNQNTWILLVLALWLEKHPRTP